MCITHWTSHIMHHTEQHMWFITHCASHIKRHTSWVTHQSHPTLTYCASHITHWASHNVFRENSIILFITQGFNPFHCRLFGLPFLLRFLFKSTACPLFFGSLPLLWNWKEELKSNGHSGFFQHSKLRTFVRLKSSLATQDKMRKKVNEKENHWWCLSSHF